MNILTTSHLAAGTPAGKILKYLRSSWSLPYCWVVYYFYEILPHPFADPHKVSLCMQVAFLSDVLLYSHQMLWSTNLKVKTQPLYVCAKFHNSTSLYAISHCTYCWSAFGCCSIWTILISLSICIDFAIIWSHYLYWFLHACMWNYSQVKLFILWALWLYIIS